jgi:hypothetical protein
MDFLDAIELILTFLTTKVAGGYLRTNPTEMPPSITIRGLSKEIRKPA